ncbi:MAG: dTDP-4-dehydrorhamnose 3,5-epimerase [Bacteroidales bacterium]|nr:dTDP-4-dehydrorhamnose 3,5-epimerase [Bacteroidales bacterium]
MNYIKTDIEGPMIIEPKVFGDERGFFFESFRSDEFRREVADVEFVQENESWSARRGVLRGLHFQKGDSAQAKLVWVVKGRVQDVAVDIREGSPTFGKYVSVELSGDNHRMIYIPRGFAHGFAVLEDDTIFQYKCDNYYNPASEGSIRWNDPAIGVKWMLDETEVILSAKDRVAPFLNS